MVLKDLGIPLKEIKNYIKNVSPYNFIHLISAQKQKILEELNRLNQVNYIIEQRTNNIPVMSNIDCGKILLENCNEVFFKNFYTGREGRLIKQYSYNYSIILI